MPVRNNSRLTKRNEWKNTMYTLPSIKRTRDFASVTRTGFRAVFIIGFCTDTRSYDK